MTSPKKEKIISIEEIENFEDYVYDLEVDECHSFLANGIFVHNTDSNFWKHCENKNKDEVKKLLKEIVSYVQSNCPNPVETFDIDIEKHIDYIRYVNEDGKKLKKNYFYVYTDKKGNKQVQIMGLPIIKRNGTALGKLLLSKYIIPKIKETNTGRFEKKWLLEIIEEELKKDISLMAQEYRCGKFLSYSVRGRSCINAQASKSYFNGKSGKIKLIKNKVVGKVGSDFKYCTIEEAKKHNLKISDLDLSKIYNELYPFSKSRLDIEEKKPTKGFFNSNVEKSQISNTINIQPIKGFFG